MSEAELPSTAGAGAAAAVQQEDGPAPSLFDDMGDSGPCQEGQLAAAAATAEAAAGAGAAAAGEPPAPAGEPATAAGDPAGDAEAGSSGDEGGFGGGLFDEDFISALEPSKPSTGKKRRGGAAAAEAAVPLQPWGGSGSGAGGGGGGKKAGGKKGGKAAADPAIEVQQPKAVLQQRCQRSGWPAPRYERLSQGGMRLEVRAQEDSGHVGR